jgi:hypothetical protein
MVAAYRLPASRHAYDQRIETEDTSMIGGTILIVVATGFLATVVIAMLRDARQL